jgi:hypothetical protein
VVAAIKEGDKYGGIEKNCFSRDTWWCWYSFHGLEGNKFVFVFFLKKFGVVERIRKKLEILVFFFFLRKLDFNFFLVKEVFSEMNVL